MPFEGRGSSKYPRKGYRKSSLTKERRIQVLRQLLTVLEDLIDENEGKEDTKGRKYNIIHIKIHWLNVYKLI